jgi:two-component system, LuxR family, response regulator FixJ
MIHIVDDDNSIRRALTMLAKSANFESDNFAGADDFLKSDKINDDDILLLDIHMPGKNGFDMLEELGDKAKKLKVIILTAFDDAENRALAQKYGVRAFFRKPCDSQALIDSINFLKTTEV